MEVTGRNDEAFDDSRQGELMIDEFPAPPIVTLPFLGVQSVWSTEMAFGWPCSLHLAKRLCFTIVLSISLPTISWSS